MNLSGSIAAVVATERPKPCFKLPKVNELDALALKYRSAKPFPHIALDDMLAEHLISGDVEFPDLSWHGWSQFTDGYQFGKRACNHLELFPPILHAMTIEASQPRFLKFLEELTGIRGLIPDPYLNGGGLHSSGPGGVLAPHTDFHVYSDLDLYRRVNVLFYFNLDWLAEYGGSLELTERGATTPTVSIPPVFGRMVAFNTDDISVHGFTRPVADGRRRNSLAFYYYTAGETGVFSGDRTTHWQAHGKATGIRWLRILAYKKLLLASRALSRLAHMANPNVATAGKGVTDQR